MNWYGIDRMTRQHQDDLKREARRHALAHSARLDRGGPGIRSLIAGMPARLGAAIPALTRRDHSLTDHPCRLPDGGRGRVSVIQQDGDWAFVCVVA